ncbi:uncharacterized protein LOC105238996 isoform X2 [Ailuropoda melanoleuca]|uniref:uncharacterized protein LOC105238996 isoform X2 n=1 Tax=Ailuropoda melanoleuca TaxID=9646 RepID=UPI0014945D1B|nr:uncharacterized protein LOC105238996 isoform X2 [Ailuropoda melanoleuca]
MLWRACHRSPAAGYRRRCCARRGQRLDAGHRGSSVSAPPCVSPPGPACARTAAPEQPARPLRAFRGEGVGVRRGQPAAGRGHRAVPRPGPAAGGLVASPPCPPPSVCSAWFSGPARGAPEISLSLFKQTVACLLFGKQRNKSGNGHELWSQVCRWPSVLHSHCPDVNRDLAFSPREKGKAHGHTVLGSWAHSAGIVGTQCWDRGHTCRVACTASSLALALVDSAARQRPSQASSLPPQHIACPPQGTFITGNPDSLLCVLGQNCHLYHWQEKRSGRDEVETGLCARPF